MHNQSTPDNPSLANPGFFKLKKIDPEQYRSQTRKATWIIIAVFIALAMLLSSLLVMFFGEAGGDNFRLNIAGVAAGVLTTAALVRLVFIKQPWMAANIYGWQLKRSLMSVTNVMHHVTDGGKAHNPVAMKLLRFYHLGLMQMHQLDANSSETSQIMHEINAHMEQMTEMGIDCDQPTLDPAWLQAIKKKG